MRTRGGRAPAERVERRSERAGETNALGAHCPASRFDRLVGAGRALVIDSGCVFAVDLSADALEFAGPAPNVVSASTARRILTLSAPNRDDSCPVRKDLATTGSRQGALGQIVRKPARRSGGSAGERSEALDVVRRPSVLSSVLSLLR